MARINWDQEVEDVLSLKDGVYLAEVKGCEERTSSKGDPMFYATFQAVDFNAHLCSDFIMLAGKGWSMGSAKLRALGFDEGQEEIAPGELIGRRVYLRCAYEEREGRDGKTYKGLKVVAEFQPFSSGYWPESEAPAGVMKPGEREASQGSATASDSAANDFLDVNDAPF